MLHYIDKQLKGHALIFDGPMEVFDKAEEGVADSVVVSWKSLEERKVFYEKIRKELISPKPEDIRKIEEFTQRIKDKVPEPLNRKRKARRSESEGEIEEIDLYISGVPDYLREMKREFSSGCYQVSLLCNMDGGVSPFMRGAAAIALADVLENAGYACEVLMWCAGIAVFPKPYRSQFVTCRIKEMGQAVDISSICFAFTHDFLYYSIFGSFSACPHPYKPVSIGGADYTLGEWVKYMDISEGARKVQVPISWNEEEIIRKITEILNHITDPPKEGEGETEISRRTTLQEKKAWGVL